MPYSIEEFINELKLLLCKAHEAGIDNDTLCDSMEHVIEYDWPTPTPTKPTETSP